MIKRRFYKLDHGDRDGSDHSSSSSDEDYDNPVADVKHDEDDDGDEAGSTSSGSGYKSEDSSANDVDVNSEGVLFSEDDAETITERPMLMNKELPSECHSEKSNDLAEEKPLPFDMPPNVLKFKSVFKCRICPRIICLTEDTLRDHLQSKRHARSEKLYREGRLKAVLHSDGEIENLEGSEDSQDDEEKNDREQKQQKKKFRKKKREIENLEDSEDSQDDTEKNDTEKKQQKKKFRKKKSDNANRWKKRSTKESAKKRRKNDN